MTQVKAKAIASNLTTPGATIRFMLKPVGTKNYTFDDLVRLVATHSGMKQSTVRYILECNNSVVTDLLANNGRVHTGSYVAHLGIGGSLDAINEQPTREGNPVHAVLTPEGDIVDKLAVIDVINSTLTVAAILNEIQESGCDELNKLTTANASVVINGQYIDTDPADTDTGVYLCDATTSAILKTATIVSHDSSRLVVKFAALPEDGQYKLVVLTRNGDDDMDVVSVSRIVTVETAVVA